MGPAAVSCVAVSGRVSRASRSGARGASHSSAIGRISAGRAVDAQVGQVDADAAQLAQLGHGADLEAGSCAAALRNWRARSVAPPATARPGWRRIQLQEQADDARLSSVGFGALIGRHAVLRHELSQASSAQG